MVQPSTGKNGYIWMGPTRNSLVQGGTTASGGFALNLEPITPSEREVLARLRACVLILAKFVEFLFTTVFFIRCISPKTISSITPAALRGSVTLVPQVQHP